MKYTLGDKLRLLRTQHRMTQDILSKHIGVSQMAIRNWESGAKSPSMSAIIALSKALSVSSDYLLGIEESYPNMTKDETHLLNRYRVLDKTGKRIVLSVCDLEAGRISGSDSGNSGRLDKQVRKKTIPLFLTPAAAGISATIDECEFKTIEVDIKNRADFAVIIRGNSMEPIIHDGDTVYVSKTQDLCNGDVGIFGVDGSIYCKLYYRKENGDVELMSANRELQNLNINLSESGSSSFVCYGRVIL